MLNLSYLLSPYWRALLFCTFFWTEPVPQRQECGHSGGQAELCEIYHKCVLLQQYVALHIVGLC